MLTGVTPQLINTKVIDAVGVDDERKIEVRREATDFVRKIIAGTFAVRSSKEVGKQYFRVTNDFYLMQLTMMKGGRSQNNTLSNNTQQKNKKL